MKKKALIALLVYMACFAMVSCSMDDYAKLGKFMGNMGNNIYGIKANMKDVDATAEKVNSAVSVQTTTNEDGTTSYTATVELVKTEDLVTSVASIKNSPQKTEELQKKLDEPIASKNASKEEKEAIQTALKDKMETVINDAKVEDSTLDALNNDAVKEAYQAVTTALSNIKDGISDNPTKADLATVSIVSDLATAVKTLASDLAKTGEDSLTDDQKTEKVLEQADKAFAALDALKVTTTAANIDILKDVNFSSLLKSLTSSSTSKEEDKEESSSDESKSVAESRDASTDESTDDPAKNAFIQNEKFLEDTVRSIVKMVTDDNGDFSDEKYNKFLFQLRAIRTAYEMTAWLTTPTNNSTGKVYDFAFVDNLLNGSTKASGKFSTNDAVLYTVAFALTEGEDFFKTYGAENNKDAIKTLLKLYAWYFKGNHTNEELSNKWSEVEKTVSDINIDALKTETALPPLVSKVKTALNTDLVIILDAGFDLKDTLDAFKILQNAEAKSYADLLSNALEELKKEINGAKTSTQEGN